MMVTSFQANARSKPSTGNSLFSQSSRTSSQFRVERRCLACSSSRVFGDALPCDFDLWITGDITLGYVEHFSHMPPSPGLLVHPLFSFHLWSVFRGVHKEEKEQNGTCEWKEPPVVQGQTPTFLSPPPPTIYLLPFPELASNPLFSNPIL